MIFEFTNRRRKYIKVQSLIRNSYNYYESIDDSGINKHSADLKQFIKKQAQSSVISSCKIYPGSSFFNELIIAIWSKKDVPINISLLENDHLYIFKNIIFVWKPGQMIGHQYNELQ